jgi:DNA repair exonuclease SbcCD ATPase subunit
MSVTLDDFRAASEKEGVDAIPFSDLYSDTRGVENDKESSKREAWRYPFDTFVDQKDSLLKEIDEQMREMDDIKKQVNDLKAANPSGEVYFGTFQQELASCQTAINAATGKINDLRNEMARGVDAWNRFSTARGTVRIYFDKVKDRLNEVRSDPAKVLGSSPSDEDLKKLLDYIGIIEGKIAAGEQDHSEQEKGAEGKSNEFSKLINDTQEALSKRQEEIEKAQEEIKKLMEK